MENSIYFSSQDIERIFQISRKKLYYWRKIGLFMPKMSTGKHYRYDFKDLVAIKAIIRLKRTGLSTYELKKALKKLKEEYPWLNNPLAEKTLFVFNKKVYAEGAIPFNLSTGQGTFIHNGDLKDWVKAYTLKSLGSDEPDQQLKLKLG